MPSGKHKGNRVVSGVYINPEEEANDAEVASILCIGGPIKYKLHPEMEEAITTEWLKTHVVPNIGHRFNDNKLIRVLGLAQFCVCMDEDNFDLPIPVAMVARVQNAYSDITIENKPEQPVLRVPIVCYRVRDNLHISEAVVVPDNEGAAGAAPQEPLIAAGGGVSSHHYQGLMNELMNLKQDVSALRMSMEASRTADREHYNRRFDKLNDNIRRFGGTIQGAFTRQANQGERRAAADETLVQNNIPNRRVNWPNLSPNLRTLEEYWREWEFGMGNNKAAKHFTAEERGRVKMKFYRRRCIWNIMVHLINKGHNHEAAIALIKQTYGQRTSCTAIHKAIVRDKALYKNYGGMHPNFR